MDEVKPIRKASVKVIARPCPFCSGEPTVLSQPGLGFKVTCENQDCRVAVNTSRCARRGTAVAYWNGEKPPRSGP